jgi:hypothetical protein
MDICRLSLAPRARARAHVEHECVCVFVLIVFVDVVSKGTKEGNCQARCQGKGIGRHC